MESLPPTALTRAIEQLLNEELEAFPTTILSVFGQTIKIIESDEWTWSLQIEHIGYGVIAIPWMKQHHSNPYLDWILRSWTIDRIRTHIDLGPIKVAKYYFSLLHTFETDPVKLESLIFDYIQAEAIEAALLSKKEQIIALRAMYRWCLEEDLPGFNEHNYFELEQIKTTNQDNRYFVTMRDVNHGPFTRAQLSLAENNLETKKNNLLTQRAMFLLGRDWGLRPIQMALLQTPDFDEDEGGPFVMVPSVKGIRRSKLRRHPSNMVKRYIADDTAEAVRAQCKEAERLVTEATPRIMEICRVHDLKIRKLHTPLFPSPDRMPERLVRLLQNPKLAQYALHMDSNHISHNMRSLTWLLGIKNPHSRATEVSEYMEISAYRLRRTKGTSMVLSGATPEEVAEALDHQSIHSISHYFRYNLDLHDFINRVHMASPEIRTAVEMWSGRFLPQNDEDDFTYRPISNLGKCSRSTPCPYHPTVTCYACSSFRPSRFADHQAALRGIQDFQSMLASGSTGPIAQQVEAALYGAKAILIAIKELP